jgi:hypothetical protein
MGGEDRQKLDSPGIQGIATTRAPDFLSEPKVGRIKADSYDRYNGRDDLYSNFLLKL